MVRLMLDSGEEQLVKRSAVKPVQDGGLFTMWLASGPGLAVYRCEVVAKRHVILALESEMDPEQAMREVRPNDLRKGLRVRGHVGDGVVTSASKELGLCSVHWHSGGDEAVFCKDLKMQNGNATRVVRDAPRNLRHSCLVEMQMTESDFQQQHNQGDFSEDGWPRVSSVYEAEQPLLFDLMCRLGPVVRLSTPQLPDQRRGMLRIEAKAVGTCGPVTEANVTWMEAKIGNVAFVMFMGCAVQEAAPPESESEDAFGSHTWCDGSVSAASAASESDDDNSKQASSLTFSNPSNPTTNSVRQLSTLMPEIV
ncbi:unnamed protein product [Durusdinium trenchii]|uniref:Anaphase-promoting complex subunit 1 n=1 Tax=Durusdinium trenchii TaxID=1381693 RepID=A0ABP0RRD0_9DINO